LQSCYQRLDKFLLLWQDIAVTASGHSVPILTSIGNHEAKDFRFHQTKNEAQLYLRSFSHRVGDYGMETSVFHAHSVGNHSSIVVMDSGVVERHENQVEWLRNTWSGEHKDRIKYALYHAPLYPSARGESSEMSVIGLKYWLPLFDQFNLTVSFENHDHMLKRTKNLKNGKEVLSNQKGTVK
jgi:hypothetical protein